MKYQISFYSSFVVKMNVDLRKILFCNIFHHWLSITDAQSSTRSLTPADWSPMWTIHAALYPIATLPRPCLLDSPEAPPPAQSSMPTQSRTQALVARPTLDPTTLSTPSSTALVVSSLSTTQLIELCSLWHIWPYSETFLCWKLKCGLLLTDYQSVNAISNIFF